MAIKSSPQLSLTLLLMGGLCCPSAMSQVDPKVAAQCKDARDFQGCVKAFTTPAETTDELSSLRGAMKQVAARLRSGTSLRDSSTTFQPVVDQLALVESTYPDSLAVRKAKKASLLFDVLQEAWGARIKAENYSLNKYGGTKIYNCKVLKLSADMFDRAYGSGVINWSYSKGLFGSHQCKVPYGQLPEDYMRPIINGLLDEGSEDPKVVAAREAAAKRKQELCAMGPWNRYLEENPAMAAWAKNNPKLAEAKKQKIINDPKNQKSCGTSSDLRNAFSETLPWTLNP